MAHELQEYIFPTQVVTANGNLSALYTTHPIVGEIVQVRIKSIDAGSYLIRESGTNNVILYTVAASGTNTSVFNVIHTQHNISGTAFTTENLYAHPIVDNPIYLTGSGLVSGNQLVVSLLWRK